MVLEEHKRGLYVTIPIYFCVLLGCAVWANIRNRQDVLRASNPDSQRRPSLAGLASMSLGGGASSNRDAGPRMLNSEDTMGSVITAIGMGSTFSGIASGNTDFLSSHYLGGRSLGPLLTTGTLFASFFSGYTVVGIPNEAYRDGWMAFRWMAGGMAIMMGLFGTNLRLRKAALVRNHKTPIDFITDRFQSQLLRYTVLVLQIVPSMCYLMAQVVALKSAFNSIFDLPKDVAYPVLIIMGITLFFEWIGGMRCVAMTDCVQGSIMILAYLCLPAIVGTQFGGWKDLDPTTYPRPDFYQTPSLSAQLQFWQFSMTLFSFFTFPHMMQRTYAARNLKSLKCAFFTMGCGVWFLIVTGVFLGTMAVQILEDSKNVDNPFTLLLTQVIDLGGFPKVIGLITITATLAAIMSTADSLLVAISQLITEEVVYPLQPRAPTYLMVWVGRAASFCAVVIASLMGISWDKGVSDVATINFQLSSQSVFIFMIGLFGTEKYDCHPWNLALASLCGFAYVFAIYFGYISTQDSAMKLNAGVSGLALQVVLILFFECFRRVFLGRLYQPQQQQQQHWRQPTPQASDLIFPNRPKWDIPLRERFGEKPLTPDLLWRMMQGIQEPLANPWYAALMFFAISRCTPWGAGGYPKEVEGIAETLVGTLPWWAIQMLISLLIPTACLFIALYLMPNRFPKYVRRTGFRGAPEEGTINTASIPAGRPVETPDPDVMELTPEELGYRTAYDNNLVYKRRRQILEKLGISPTEVDSIVASTQEQLKNFQPHL